MESALPREHLVENRPKRKNVRSSISGFPPDLLRRHIARRSQHSARLGRDLQRWRFVGQIGFGTSELGKPEIEDLDVSGMGNKKVFGLEVAMHDTLFVRRRQPAGDLLRP